MQELMQKLEPLCLKPKIHGADTGDVTAGSVETDDQASLNRISASREHNRNDRGRGFRRKSRGCAARCHDDSHRPAYKISRQFWQPAALVVPPAVFDRHV